VAVGRGESWRSRESGEVSYGCHQALLVPLQGAQPRGDLQERGAAQLGADGQESTVLLHAEAVQRLVTHLREKRDFGYLSGAEVDVEVPF